MREKQRIMREATLWMRIKTRRLMQPPGGWRDSIYLEHGVAFSSVTIDDVSEQSMQFAI